MSGTVSEALKQRYKPYQALGSHWFTVGFNNLNSPQRANPWNNEHFTIASAPTPTTADNIAALNEHGDTYSTLCVFAERPNGKGTRAEVAYCAWLWVDLDIYRAPASIYNDETRLYRQPTKAEAIDALNHFVPQPTLIIDSGGGLYGLWQLQTPTDDIEAIEARNRWLEATFSDYGADAVGNVDRVLRLPGTVNYKYQLRPSAQTLHYYPKNTYGLNDFSTAERDHQHPLLDPIDNEPIPANFETRVRTLKPWLWERIYSEETARAAGAKIKDDGRVDRSHNDFVIALSLLSQPLLEPAGVVASVLSHPEWFSGDKGFTNRSYVEHTLQAALARIATTTEDANGLSDIAFVTTPTGARKFAPAAVQNFLKDRYNFRHYRGQLYYYDPNKHYHVLENDRFVPELLYAALDANYVSRYADEVRKELLQLADLEEGEDAIFVNLRDGILNPEPAEGGQFHFIPHPVPSIFHTSQLPVSWNTPLTDEALTTLDNFVTSIVGEANVALLYEFIGHMLVRYNVCKGLLFLYGPPDAGKSQLIILIQEFLSRANYSAVDLLKLSDDRFAASELVDKRANLVSESSNEVEIDQIGLIKAIAAGEPVRVERKYQDGYEAAVTAKMMFCTNQKPTARKPDEGWFRRIFMIPCTNQFRAGVPGFRAQIGRALGSDDYIKRALLHRALEGLTRLRQRQEYTLPEAVKQERDNLRRDTDTVLAWWETACEPDPNGRIKVTVVNKEYQAYARSNNRLPLSSNKFRTRTEELVTLGLLPQGVHKKVLTDEDGKSTWFWVGMRLVEHYTGGIILSQTPTQTKVLYGSN